MRSLGIDYTLRRSKVSWVWVFIVLSLLGGISLFALGMYIEGNKKERTGIIPPQGGYAVSAYSASEDVLYGVFEAVQCSKHDAHCEEWNRTMAGRTVIIER